MFEKLNRKDETPGERLTSVTEPLRQVGRPLVLDGAFRRWAFVTGASRSDEDSLELLG